MSKKTGNCAENRLSEKYRQISVFLSFPCINFVRVNQF